MVKSLHNRQQHLVDEKKKLKLVNQLLLWSESMIMLKMKIHAKNQFGDVTKSTTIVRQVLVLVVVLVMKLIEITKLLGEVTNLFVIQRMMICISMSHKYRAKLIMTQFHQVKIEGIMAVLVIEEKEIARNLIPRRPFSGSAKKARNEAAATQCASNGGAAF